MSKPFSKSIDEQIPVEDLAANARIKVKEDVRHVFAEYELAEMKADYFEQMSRLNARIELAAQIKSAVEQYPDPLDQLAYILEEADEAKLGTSDVKALKSSTNALMQQINAGYDHREQVLYGYDYQDCSRMAFYDEHGLFVYDRALKPEEKQTSIITQIKKTA